MVAHIEYMVKPFQDSKDLPIDGCAKMEVPPFAHNPFVGILGELSRRGISADGYLDKMLLLWKERVDYVDRTPDSLLVMIDIFRDDSTRPIRLRELRDYAVHALGERFISLPEGYVVANFLNERGYLHQKVCVHAYGEVSDRCARGETNELVRTLREIHPAAQVVVEFDKKLCSDTIDGKFD